MEASFFTRHPLLKDLLSLTIFVICVIIGTIIINTFVFRSYNVVGPSMEQTMYTGDRLIVNRLPVTWSSIRGESYLPERGQIIVFKNPHFSRGIEDEFIVKRVIGLPGEHVTLQNGQYVIYNKEHPEGFNPDDENNGEPGSPTSGTADVVVPKDQIFVSGDHREGNFSYDSRNGDQGMGTIPLYDVVGPVSMRIFPFNQIRTF
ncbi:MAG: signal peptidase I [Candidatus Saccharimonadota bacterium]|jgi:signal peptidase I